MTLRKYQENTSATPSFVCDETVSATGSSTDNTDWLNKICTELVYHNLAFLAKYRTSQAVSTETAVSEDVSDSVDGCIGVTGHKIIKSVVGIILEHLVDRHLNENCYGCEVDHPSQTQHSCLYEPPAYYFLRYFEELRGKVCKPGLKLILARTLKLFGLSPHLQRIQGVVDAVLCELRDEMFIVGGLAELRTKLVDETCEQAVYDAVDRWKESEPADSD